MRRIALVSLALGCWLGAGLARAQGPLQVVPNDAWCGDDGDRGGDGRERHCEVWEATWPAGNARIDADASPNGGIEVRGWDRPEVRLRAKVVAVAPTAGEAGDLADQVRIDTVGEIRATGPRGTRHSPWWVSYELSVPRKASLGLRSVNGGISVRDVAGAVSFETTNGGVRLHEVAGRVHGRTTNGGLDIRLAGAAWAGDGLDVATTNGGVTLAIPADYNARVETGTTNGRLEVDFPVTLQGRIDRKHLAFELGKGGPLVRATTTNGGVVVKKR
ncbi:MAG TPA: hypothetical protein VLL75_03380 [Vicinamibacteria bacterium]|nr:hypothetical protein [Vicinamibacteria bacterium]